MEKNKEVKMGVVKNEDEQKNAQPQKYTYEQLNDIANRLFQENQYLKQQLQQAEKFIQTFNRLDYLLKIVEIQNSSKSYVFNNDFCYRCVQEIEEIMTIPEEKEKENSKEE